jgi:hypothetical protein
MLFIHTTGASCDLCMLLREPAFRIVAPVLAGFMGYCSALHIRSRIGRRKLAGRTGVGR